MSDVISDKQPGFRKGKFTASRAGEYFVHSFIISLRKRNFDIRQRNSELTITKKKVLNLQKEIGVNTNQ